MLTPRRAAFLSCLFSALAACSSGGSGPSKDALPDGTVVDASEDGSGASVDDGGTSRCQGIRPACDTLDASTCAVAGCTVVTGSLCSGTAATCDAYVDDAVRCVAAGCTNKANKCQGTPTACDQLDVSVCGRPLSSIGCVVSDACTGTASACTSYDVQDACEQQAGCAWQ